MGELAPVVGGGLTVIAVIVSLAIAFLRQVGAGAKDHASQVAGWARLNERANEAVVQANERANEAVVQANERANEAVVQANLRAEAAEERAAAAERKADDLRAEADEMRQLAEAIAAGTAARLAEMDEKVARLLEHRPEGLTDGT